jgi:hypothetical protein
MISQLQEPKHFATKRSDTTDPFHHIRDFVFDSWPLVQQYSPESLKMVGRFWDFSRILAAEHRELESPTDWQYYAQATKRPHSSTAGKG